MKTEVIEVRYVVTDVFVHGTDLSTGVYGANHPLMLAGSITSRLIESGSTGIHDDVRTFHM